MRGLIIIVFTLSSLVSQAQGDVQKKVEDAVISWADATFEFYDAPRFENFETEPHPDFYMLQMQLQTLQEFKEEIVFNFNEGNSDRTEEKLTEDTIKINQNMDEMRMVMEMFEPKYSGYNINFWANIQTNNGLTVYYQHYVTLSDNFEVTDAKVTKAVGKESDDVEIIYKE